jgi:hypothetical protein
MQRFFHGSHLLNHEIDADLRIGTDNLLRVLASIGDHPYCLNKLGTALSRFEKYRVRKGGVMDFYSKGDALHHELHYMRSSIQDLAVSSGGLPIGEAFLLKLNTALLEYGVSQGANLKEPYPEINSSLDQMLREYLNYAMIYHLSVSLPAQLDEIWTGDMRDYCRSSWEQIEVLS